MAFYILFKLFMLRFFAWMKNRVSIVLWSYICITWDIVCPNDLYTSQGDVQCNLVSSA